MRPVRKTRAKAAFPAECVVGGGERKQHGLRFGIRDREIDVVNIGSSTPSVVKRIKLKGQPNKMVLNAAQSRYLLQRMKRTPSR